MENYDSLIELLKGFEYERVPKSENEFDNDDTGIYNGFPCDEVEDTEVYKTYLNDLYKAAFTDVKKAIDGLLVKSYNPSLLDVFFQSKMDDLAEIEKAVEGRNDKITEEKIDNSNLYYDAKSKFEKEGGDRFDKELIELFENWKNWKRHEELYYRGNIDIDELVEAGVPLKDRAGNRHLARIVMEKEQRNMIKSTKSRMNELYGIYCPKQNIAEEIKQTSLAESQAEKDFKSYLHHDNKDALMEKLHELIDGKKGKLVVIIIKSLEKLSFIGGYENRATLYNAMRKEFGNIGTNAGLNDFLSKDYKIANVDIDKYIGILESIE